MRDWREEHRESRFKWPLKLPSTHVEGVSTLAEAQEVMDSKISLSARRYGTRRSSGNDRALERITSFNKRYFRKVFRQAMRIVDTKLAESEASNFRLRLEPLSENVADKYRQDQANLVHTLQELGVQPEQIERE